MTEKNNKAVYAESIEELKKRALDGDSEAQYEIGIRYYHGKSVKCDPKLSFLWIKTAAIGGNVDAQNSLSVMYKKGDACKPDISKAFKWAKRAAKNRHPEAQFNLSIAFKKGQGCKPHLKRSFRWLKRAAHQNETAAQYNLAFAYLDGEGCNPDEEKAYSWMKTSADNGRSDAQYNLAIMLGEGIGCEPDYEKSFIYAKKAVKQSNNPDGYYLLGLLYHSGAGCKKSLDKAQKYFKKATNAGVEKAYQFLNHPSFERIFRGTKCKNLKSAFDDLQALIQEIMDSCRYCNYVDGPIYHFTRWPAINSILPKESNGSETNIIRLYHEDYMNDPNEGKSLLDTFRRSTISTHQKPYELLRDVYDDDINIERELSKHDATYMASFTMSSDRLDLWRAYGADGDGYSLRVNIKSDENFAWSLINSASGKDERTYSLYKVQYSEKAKKKAVKKIAIALNKLRRHIPTDNEELKRECHIAIYYMLNEVMYLYKDEQYSSENEVRLFTRKELHEAQLDESDIGKLFTTTGPILFTGPDSEIVIGPKVKDKRAVELSLKKRLLENGHHHTKVRHSEIDYR
ncbi:DUF2971 domain-containing protein [Veronia pacifica]|nr:DUF2971 domain-containing protein [Veronia pacifica]